MVHNLLLFFRLPPTSSSEKSQRGWGAGPRLETDVCVAGQQAADPELIQSYVKKVSLALFWENGSSELSRFS